MRAFSRRGQTLQTRLAGNEITVLGTLVGELVELLGPLGPRAGDEIFAEPPPFWKSDPALARLFPDAYRGDDDASNEFERYTMADQTVAKIDAAKLVLADIEDADDGWVTVPPDHIESWLITLTNLRLVLAERLGVVNIFDSDDMDTPMAAVYTWCGWFLESMLDQI